ncbi:IS21 family transposase (plasmid) [Novosphingobium sp. BL-8A]
MSSLDNATISAVSARRDTMLEPDEVTAMLRLNKLGWGSRRIAREFGCSRTTVQRYVDAGGWQEYRSPRKGVSKLDGHEAWLRDCFFRHRGNADVVRQDLARELGVRVSLRTVERAVSGYRQELAAEAVATMRFETPPGHQMQIDFGEKRVQLGGEMTRVYMFVATLGYSRRIFAMAFLHERQSAWLDGIETAFRYFGGTPAEVLLDNARALVKHHDAATREVVFNDRLHAFSRYWGFRPRACAPYRARTKGKDERGVGYVKHNALAGHSFASMAALEQHIAWWLREVADARCHGSTGEPPLLRFVRDEACKLKPLQGRPPFRQIRELVRKVHSDCAVEIDTNAYSVPWRLVGESVQVTLSGAQVRIFHGGQLVAEHAEASGRHRRLTDPAHFAGVSGVSGPVLRPVDPEMAAMRPPDLLRPLLEYEQLAGGRW